MKSILERFFGDEISTRAVPKTIQAEWSEGMDAQSLTPDGFYFDIRLCEMYLRKKVDAGREFVPRALAITECLYGKGQKLTLPIAVGEHILAEIEAMTDSADPPRAISLTNCLLAGPMPYRGGDIGFFNGLYRVHAGNTTDSVINLVADVTGSLGLNIDSYLNIGQQLATRLPSLLSTDNSNWRIGHYGPIYKPADKFFNRYLVLFGEEGDSFDMDSLDIDRAISSETLVVKDADGKRPFDARDYLLIKLNGELLRNDYERFDFHNRFQAVKDHLIDHNIEKAEWARNALNHEIGACPDLTGEHQLELILMYEMKTAKWKVKLDLEEEFRPSSNKGAVKSKASGLRTGAIASAARRAELPDATVDTLSNLEREWGDLETVLSEETDKDPSNQAVNDFLQKMKSKKITGGTAADLAEAIKIHSLSHRN